MSQSNLPNAGSTSAAIAAAAAARQLQQIQANAAAAAAAAVSTAAVTDSLVTNAFDLIGGTQAAQQFINQIDLYAQQQRRQQQQQQQQQHQQQQQQHHQHQSQQQQQQQQQHHQKQLEQLFSSNYSHYNHDATSQLSPSQTSPRHQNNHNHQNSLHAHHHQFQQQVQHTYQHHPQSSLSSSSTSTASSSSSPPSSSFNFQQLMAQNQNQNPNQNQNQNQIQNQNQNQTQNHHHNINNNNNNNTNNSNINNKINNSNNTSDNNNNHNNNNNQYHNSSNYNKQQHQQQHQQQQPQQQQQQPHLSKQHSIASSLLSLTSTSTSTSPLVAAAKSPTQRQSISPPQSLSPTNSKTAALLANLSNNNQQNQQKSQLTLDGILSTIQNHQNNQQNNKNQQLQQHQRFQMDGSPINTQSQQQQQQQQQQASSSTSIEQASTTLSNAVSSMPSTISRVATTILATPPMTSPTSTQQHQNQHQQQHASQQQNQQQHQHPQQQHQHHHHHGGNGASQYKSCWCFGESVCSGIEVEIENNNNYNYNHPGESTYHMKILVPAVASGAIIGKGGETIASLQKDTGARVKMSKSHDFYPGTTERVCLITGSVEGIMTVLDFIMDKIREKPDLATKIMDSDSKQNQERDKQVKILVPNSTAGMIIGKGGAYIKQIKEESGSYVQISQKPKDISLQERCITIIGDKENNKNACKMILSKIVEDPQSGTCLNVSYADISGPVANFNPTGSPYATNQNAINSSTASLNSTLGTAIGGAATAAGLLVNGTAINLSLNLGAHNTAPNLAVATQLLEHIKVAMRGAGYAETAITEVCAALGVLAKYGVLGMGVGVPHATNGAHATLGSYLGVSALDQQTAAAANAATAGNVFGAVGQVNLEQYTAAAAAAAAAAARPTQSQLDAAAAAAQFDPFRHLGSAAAAAQAATPVSLNNNSFGLTAATGSAGATAAQTLSAAAAAHTLSGLSKSPTPGDLGPKDSKNVEIPEVIVGAILGPNGRSLVEIQHVSGASVQISKKGIFAPGTRNRIVTITGQPSAIAKAQFLIEQKINEEETKRARQIPLTTVVN